MTLVFSSVSCGSTIYVYSPERSVTSDNLSVYCTSQKTTPNALLEDSAGTSQPRHWASGRKYDTSSNQKALLAASLNKSML